MNKKKVRSADESSTESDDFKRLEQEKKKEKEKIRIAEMKVINDEFIENVFGKRRVTENGKTVFDQGRPSLKDI